MHYYPHHIGDFIRDTSRLNDSQCMAYLRLMWLYYENEEPLLDNIELLAFKIGSDKDTVAMLLQCYFDANAMRWHHNRIDKVLEEYKSKSDKARNSAKTRWNNANAMRTHSEGNANHKPITNNHTKNIGRGSRLPQDWIIPEDYIKFCHEERPDLIPEDVAAQFKDYWISVSGAKGVKTDWFATWRNWVRRQDVAKSKFKNKGSLMSDAQFEDWLTPKGVEHARIG